MRNINKQTKRLIIILIFTVISGLVFAYFYYRNINDSIDPRLIETQKILADFDNINKLDSSFVAIDLMNKLEQQLKEIDLYHNSYEIGVVYNNRASVYLMLAVYNDEYKNMKDSLFNMALNDLSKADNIYNNWIKWKVNINDAELKIYLKTEYNKASNIFKDKDINSIIEHRVKDLKLAEIETPRRLSVVYSNIAVIKRHTNKLDDAIAYYTKSLELWPKNHEAKNNLNVLCGKEKEKQSVINKMFPSKRDKE